MIGEKGDGLLLILSQPRAGSTLLQRMLGAHPAIHTVQEPAVALHPLRGLQALGNPEARRENIAHYFTHQFLAELPHGEETYVTALRQMLTHVYNEALSTSDASSFLDKTPRYFTIIPELARVFPEARYIILLRNPLAVLGSVLDTWVQGEWLGVAHARPDLLQAPGLLLAGRELLGESAVTVHYEQLVQAPQETLALLCEHIGLPYHPDVLTYAAGTLPRWPHGDQTGVYRHKQPDPAHIDKWQEQLQHPQVWRFSRDYLYALGPATVASLGYDFGELAAIVQRAAPSPFTQRLTFSLEWMSRHRPDARPWWQRRLVWLQRRLLARG